MSSCKGCNRSNLSLKRYRFWSFCFCALEYMLAWELLLKKLRRNQSRRIEMQYYSKVFWLHFVEICHTFCFLYVFVTAFSANGKDVIVDFPQQSHWTGLLSEMELVPSIHPGVT